MTPGNEVRNLALSEHPIAGAIVLSDAAAAQLQNVTDCARDVLAAQLKYYASPDASRSVALVALILASSELGVAIAECSP